MRHLNRLLKVINRWLVRCLEEGGSKTWNTDARPNRPRRRK